MTDNEIIKALENVAEWFTEHGRNTNTAVIGISRQALDLIKRQQAEIEDLKATIHSITTEQADCLNNLICTNLEELVKKFEDAMPLILREIDNLVKEMVGDDND